MLNEEIQKAIDKVKKLRRQAESETILGNEGTGFMFAEKADEVMQKFGITNDMVVDAPARLQGNELGKSIIANPFLKSNARTNMRHFWYESLAKLVASAYHCEISPADRDSGQLIFYGYDLDRELAIFMFLKMAEISHELCKKEMLLAKENVGKPSVRTMFSKNVVEYPKTWIGDNIFTDSFHRGFRNTLISAYQKHNLDNDRILKVQEYFQNENTYTKDYFAPKEISELDYATIQLGEKAGEIVHKKASNSPSALISTKTAGVTTRTIETNTVYLVLDDSGSMWGERIEQCKIGAKEFAKKCVGKGTAVGLLKFGTGVKHLLKPRMELDERFDKAIDKLKANDGSTDMHLAIQAAHAHSINRRNKRSICLVTDGQPSDRNATLEAARLAKQDGVEIITIGVEGADEAFLKLLSSREGLSVLTSGSRLALTMGEMAERLQ
jgi:Mg-chelatase subunit ChlD